MPDTRWKHRVLSANRLAALIAGVVVVLGGAGTALIGNADGGDTGAPASAGSAAPGPWTARTVAGNLSVNGTYHRDWAGVVDIRVTTTTTSPAPLGLPTTQMAQAEGAGVVFDKNGEILTDEHVVSGARTATVTFGDGTTAKAEFIGTDPSTDVAVIRVSAAATELHSAGIGFRTPSNTVANVAQRIIASRPVAHAYLGVSLNSAFARGAEVASVQSSSPA
jgi:S1-C subfamily serine protease